MEKNDEAMQKAHEVKENVDYVVCDWESKKNKKVKQFDIIGFFDIETCADDNGIHIAYQLSFWFSVGEEL